MGLIFEFEKNTEAIFHLENGSTMLHQNVGTHIKTLRAIQENNNLEVKRIAGKIIFILYN
jgi:hypothetical protein